MLLFLAASSSAFASDEVSSSDADFDLDLLQFLGETEGLESMGVDLDGLLDIDDSGNASKQQEGS